MEANTISSEITFICGILIIIFLPLISIVRHNRGTLFLKRIFVSYNLTVALAFSFQVIGIRLYYYLQTSFNPILGGGSPVFDLMVSFIIVALLALVSHLIIFGIGGIFFFTRKQTEQVKALHEPQFWLVGMGWGIVGAVLFLPSLYFQAKEKILQGSIEWAKDEAEQRAQESIVLVNQLPVTQTPEEGHAWRNSLGMTFVPAGAPGVLFSVWDTRVEDYQAFITATGRAWPKPQASPYRTNLLITQTPADPAVMVSEKDANAFCQWLTDKEHQSKILPADQFYRLPLDAEWSHAVGLNEDDSSETDRDYIAPRNPEIFPWGTSFPPPSDAGNYERIDEEGYLQGVSVIPSKDGYVYTSPVGSFRPNAFGLYDMGGNVWQICNNDIYSVYQTGESRYNIRGASWSTDTDPQNSWTNQEASLCSDYRSGRNGYGDNDVGFRCVLAVIPEQARRGEMEKLEMAEQLANAQLREKNALAAVAQIPKSSKAVAGKAFQNSLGMVYVPAGTDGVLISVWDTREEDYSAFVTATGRKWARDNLSSGPTFPATEVSWLDAEAFCQWLTDQDHKSGVLDPSARYRLPTDAEWSQAVGLKEKAGSPKSKSRVYPNINFPIPAVDVGNYFRPPPFPPGEGIAESTGYPCTSPVGSYKPNAFGLYDMGGNVWQWCDDDADIDDKRKVLRGGAFSEKPAYSYFPTFRYASPPDSNYQDVGFRTVIVMSLHH